MQDLMQPIGTPDGLFHDGNPATGELGTIVSALWLNAVQGTTISVQSELLSVLSGAGVAVDPTKVNQVLDAIKKIAWGGSGTARPTTLAGYGITDALPRIDTPITHQDWNQLFSPGLFSVVNADGPNCPAAGMGGVLLVAEAIDGLGVTQLYMAHASSQVWCRGGHGNDPMNWNPWKRLDANQFADLQGKPTTLTGYGISLPTQAEAEAGTDNTLPMPPLRVAQAITARVATQAETNAGTSDTIFVTPKKLRAGFSISLTTNGYITFPSWLGGLILQWGRVLAIPYDGSKAFTLPIAYPTEPLASFATIEANMASTSGNYSIYTQHSTTSVTTYLDGNVSAGAVAQNAWIFSIGH